MTRRLWIRAHALPEIERMARYLDGDVSGTLKLAIVAQKFTPDPNAMVVVHISDAVTEAIHHDAYLMMCGKVLAEGEEPPYLGSDPGVTEEEGTG